MNQCGCNAPIFTPPLNYTCGGGDFFIFMSLLNTIIRNTCDVSEICNRITPITQPDPEYDFIVIGGGAGGAVVAGRLSENPNWKILLIEEGGDEPSGSQVPSFMSNYDGNPLIDWNYYTEPQNRGCLGFPNKKCRWSRGKVLGGTSVIHGMMYMRGIPSDYDQWEGWGNYGWSYDEVLPYFLKSEDNLEIGKVVDAKDHNTGGPLTVTRFPYQPQLAYDILNAARHVGYPVSKDLNGKNKVGYTIAQTNSKNGVRVSSATAFLRPARNRKNLHITLHSRALKIIFKKENNQNVADCVEYNYSFKKFKIRARKEIILAAGAINSPQLLLLSGIGRKQHLDEVGIKQVHELPGVGQNLHNHVSFHMKYKMTKKNDTSFLNWDIVKEYTQKKTGPMSSTGITQVTARLNSKFADPSGNIPDIQIFHSGDIADCPGIRPSTITLSPLVLPSKSRGYLKLRSSSGYLNPLIFANYLTNKYDVAILIEGIRLIQKLTNSKILQDKYGLVKTTENYGDCNAKFKYDSNDFWECAIRYATVPENHQAGSCKMGPSSDPLAVVDPELRVHGIKGLRVMDASIMPAPVSGNAYATIVMIAEKGVDLIKNYWG